MQLLSMVGRGTVESYRRGLGLHTKLVEYGPKYSFVAVQKSELEKRGIDKVAKLIARDAVMWEQSACSSPHVVYVEGKENARALLDEIALGFDELSDILPQQNAVYQSHIFDVVDIVAPLGKFIQTVAIVANGKNNQKLASELASIGADRFVEAGKMAVRKHGSLHDGTKGLSELIRWVSLSRNRLDAGFEIGGLWEKYNPEGDYFDYLSDKERDGITLERLKNIVEYVKEHSPLLLKRYGNIQVNSFEDFQKLPFMTGDDYKKYLPPFGDSLLTGGAESVYVFSSGGTTGKPKVVYRTHDKQHFNAVRLGKGLLLSVFNEKDIVVNLLFAGNMWASFVSFNQALEHTGCVILPIGGNLKIKDIVQNLINFKANAIITIPSVLLSIAEYVDEKRH